MTGHRAWRLLVVAALAVAANAPVAAQDAAARVPTAEGLVDGVVEGGIAAWKGIPYAAAPVGPLRWRAPRPAPRRDGVLRAASFGAACPQKEALARAVHDPSPIAEDCLFLNVWAPARGPGAAPLPVMVWLHGGAYVFGSAAQPVYDGSALAARGVVVVTLNYRLGPLGFFAHPALAHEQRAEGVRHANFGLLDQVAALRWVRANIAGFGGDPRQVTLFGESAGAQSVLALYASPPARGLFVRGISQSPYGIPAHTVAKAEAKGAAVAKAVGVGTRAGVAATMAALRAVPMDRFASLGEDGGGAGLTLSPVAIAGDAVLPETPLAAFRAGRQARLPLVVGSNSDEASVALAFGLDPATLVQRLGAARILVRPHYPAGIDDATLGREVVRDVVFTAFARRVAALHAAHAPAWRYHYARTTDVERASGAFGVEHAGELVAVFGTGDRCGCLRGPWTDADRAASRALGDRWVAFAASGVPDAGSDPVWTRDSADAPRVLVLDHDGAAVRSDFMTRRLAAFNRALDVVGLLAPRNPRP